MKSNSIQRLVLAAVLAALVCVATMVITVPFPLIGYFNLGDGFALLAGWLLGPVYGFAAAGLGSALADIFLGFITYAPGTFVIKGLIALIAALLCGVGKKNKTLSSLLAAAAAEAEMVLGYFVYEALILGYGTAAAASMPLNLVQGCAGIVLFMVLSVLFEKCRLREKVLRQR